LKEKDRNGNVDPRLDYTIFYAGSKLRPYGKSYAEYTASANGGDYVAGRDRFWIKYTNYFKGNDSYFSGINNRVIRLADIMLLYAEALNEQGQTAAAIPFANRVRARVNMPNLSLTLSQAAFREQLRHDRVVELAGESHRYWDLKRYGIAGPELAGSETAAPNVANRDSEFRTFVKGKTEFFPLPLYETDANPNLKQNPGW
jgi:starch-binding outer membrane protein, SusD/RagB family